MSFKELVSEVTKFAPLLGGLLGGAPGEMVGTLISSEFGGNTSDPSDLLSRIQSDPNAALKLKAIESSNKLELQKSQIQLMIANSNNDTVDRKDARQQQIDLEKMGKHDYTRVTLTTILTVYIAAELIYLLSYGIPTTNKEIIITIMSSLSTVWLHMMSFYFGGNTVNSRMN